MKREKKQLTLHKIYSANIAMDHSSLYMITVLTVHHARRISCSPLGTQ